MPRNGLPGGRFMQSLQQANMARRQSKGIKRAEGQRDGETEGQQQEHMWQCLKLGLIKVNAKCRCLADARQIKWHAAQCSTQFNCVCVCGTLNTRMALTHSLDKALARLDSFATRRNLHARHPFVVQHEVRAKGAGRQERGRGRGSGANGLALWPFQFS